MGSCAGWGEVPRDGGSGGGGAQGMTTTPFMSQRSCHSYLRPSPNAPSPNACLAVISRPRALGGTTSAPMSTHCGRLPVYSARV